MITLLIEIMNLSVTGLFFCSFLKTAQIDYLRDNYFDIHGVLIYIHIYIYIYREVAKFNIFGVYSWLYFSVR
jgi:hypothetical protein